MISKNPKIEFLELEIKNFGPYVGIHTLEFSNHNKKNVTLITGEQGTGKTTIFQLIWWILFPKLKIEEKKSELLFLRSHEVKEAVNKIAIKNAEAGEEIEIGGKILFKTFDRSGNPSEYLIARELTFIKTTDGIMFENDSIEDSEKINIIKNNQKIIEPIKFYGDVINRFFPDAVRDFIFVNGEGLTRLLSIENVGKIKDDALAISDKPKIDALTGYLEACEKYFKEKRKEADKDIKMLNKIQKDIDKLENKREERKNEIRNLEENLERLRQQVAEYRNEMSNVKGKRDFIDEYNENRNDLENLEISKKEIVKNRENALKNGLPYIYLEDAMKKISYDIKTKRKKDIIPGKITSDMLNLILEREDKCVCGKKWTQDMRENIRKLMEISPKGKIGEAVVKFETKLEERLKKIKIYKKSILEEQKKLVRINTQINELNERQRFLKSNIPEEEREKDWYQTLTDLEDKISEGDQLIGEYKAKIQKSKEELRKTEEDLKNREKDYRKEEKESQKTSQRENYTKFIEIIEKLKDITKYMSEIIGKRIKEMTEVEVLKAIKNLAKDPENWERVLIEDQDMGWKMTAINRSGSDLTNISTGQTNVLGNAFIYGLSKILDIDLPLVIDSPFINVDLKTRKTLIENIPLIYEGRQLIFFTKKTEFVGPAYQEDKNTDLYPIIEPFVGKEYIIENETNDNARIVHR
jgi:DNA sulfur modification protein DndD